MILPDIIFSKWTPWAARTDLDKIDLPGVYILARFTTPPRGNADPHTKEVVYIGETCQTLEKRWRQFHRAAFEEKNGHSGGKNYRRTFGGNGDNLFVAAFRVNKLDLNDKLRPLFIRYVERKLIWEYAQKWCDAPECNKK